jgi:hypothetical protein
VSSTGITGGLITIELALELTSVTGGLMTISEGRTTGIDVEPETGPTKAGFTVGVVITEDGCVLTLTFGEIVMPEEETGVVSPLETGPTKEEEYCPVWSYCFIRLLDNSNVAKNITLFRR